MGAVPGRPATGESEGPRPADGDQPHGHWSHSAGLLLWYNMMSVWLCSLGLSCAERGNEPGDEARYSCRPMIAYTSRNRYGGKAWERV